MASIDIYYHISITLEEIKFAYLKFYFIYLFLYFWGYELMVEIYIHLHLGSFENHSIPCVENWQVKSTDGEQNF